VWPKQGTIIRWRRRLMIRLNNGGIMLSIPDGKDYKLGETVHVMWDYTVNQPRSVMSNEEYNTPDMVDDGPMDMARPPEWADANEWAIDF